MKLWIIRFIAVLITGVAVVPLLSAPMILFVSFFVFDAPGSEYSPKVLFIFFAIWSIPAFGLGSVLCGLAAVRSGQIRMVLGAVGCLVLSFGLTETVFDPLDLLPKNNVVTECALEGGQASGAETGKLVCSSHPSPHSPKSSASIWKKLLYLQ